MTPWHLAWLLPWFSHHVMAQYSRGEYGTDSCSGTSRVPKERCEDATLALNLFWIGEMQSTSTIAGCQVDTLNGYFNTQDSSQVNDVFAPLCEVTTTTTSSGTKTSTASSVTRTDSSTTLTITTRTTLSTTSLTQTVPVPPLVFPQDPLGQWQLWPNGTLERSHLTPRRHLFAPGDVDDCPVPLTFLTQQRWTFAMYLYGGAMNISDSWKDPTIAHLSLPYLWVGKTCFALSNASGVTTADDVGVDGTGTVDVSASASTAALGGVFLILARVLL
ncbi:unnamed protein product [Cladocopium goreaui]|uniref:Uncharacterized protein n=1 Tax=Cladocopium goreaui TaxID=2562237 RepID=A0A9P1FQZ4_9DINO|nr:unnamed protein product [Cladocopium goreaui]